MARAETVTIDDEDVAIAKTVLAGWTIKPILWPDVAPRLHNFELISPEGLQYGEFTTRYNAAKWWLQYLEPKGYLSPRQETR